MYFHRNLENEKLFSDWKRESFMKEEHFGSFSQGRRLLRKLEVSAAEIWFAYFDFMVWMRFLQFFFNCQYFWIIFNFAVQICSFLELNFLNSLLWGRLWVKVIFSGSFKKQYQMKYLGIVLALRVSQEWDKKIQVYCSSNKTVKKNLTILYLIQIDVRPFFPKK